MHRLLAVVSGKGGTGKSTLCAGLGRALARGGKRVLLIDLDAGMRCLDLLLHVSDRLVFDLSDVLAGKPLADAALAVEDAPGLFVLAAPADPQLPDPTAFRAFLEEIQAEYDFVFLDFAAGPVNPCLACLPADAEVLVVATPDEAAVRDAALLRQALTDLSGVRLVLNGFSYTQFWQTPYPSLDALIDACGLPLAGVIPFDPTLRMRKGAKHSPARQAFERLSQRLCGKSVPLPNLKRF